MEGSFSQRGTTSFHLLNMLNKAKRFHFVSASFSEDLSECLCAVSTPRLSLKGDGVVISTASVKSFSFKVKHKQMSVRENEAGFQLRKCTQRCMHRLNTSGIWDFLVHSFQTRSSGWPLKTSTCSRAENSDFSNTPHLKRCSAENSREQLLSFPHILIGDKHKHKCKSFPVD